MPRSAAAMIARSRQPHCPTIARPRTAANPSCAEPTRHLAGEYRCLKRRETGAIESAIFRPHFFTVRNDRADECKRCRQAGLGKALSRRRRGSSSGSRRRAHLAASAGAHCSAMVPAVENRGSPQRFLASAARRTTGTANAAGARLQSEPTFAVWEGATASPDVHDRT
jgi:hypothetical protein